MYGRGYTRGSCGAAQILAAARAKIANDHSAARGDGHRPPVGGLLEDRLASDEPVRTGGPPAPPPPGAAPQRFPPPRPPGARGPEPPCPAPPPRGAPVARACGG